MPVNRALRALVYPIHQFLKLEALGGLLLVAATLLAMLLANSGMAEQYEVFWKTRLGLNLGPFVFANSLHFWINHGLMALFFLFVGLEIKKEILMGVLASRRRATLPLFAAIGGILLPAVFYLLLNPPGSAGASGWSIPIATDIAFVMGVLILFGNRIPLALKIFLLALAIVDDLAGILVITFFYSTQPAWLNLGVALVLIALLFLLSLRDYRQMLPYLVIGFFLWLALLHSGISPTLAGVLLAATIPNRPLLTPTNFCQDSLEVLTGLRKLKEWDMDVLHSEDYRAGVHTMVANCQQALTPLQHLETMLHPWVNFLILPLFAFANAGIPLESGNIGAVYQSPVTWGIIAGLFLGKPLGISLSTWLAVHFKWAALPKGVTMKQLIAASFLGGIGFTLSLFLADLSLAGTPALLNAKIGIFTASAISVAAGCLSLWWALRRAQTAPQTISGKKSTV